MPATLAFDVYGTLIDTAGVVDALRRLVGGRRRRVLRRLAQQAARIFLSPRA